MIAIATTYVPATDTRSEGVRVSAVGIKPMFIAWQSGLSGKDNHQWAAMQMAFELDCAGQFFRMDNPSTKKGWLYVCIGDDVPDYAKRDGFSFRLRRGFDCISYKA
jgi:hypothetical protein